MKNLEPCFLNIEKNLRMGGEIFYVPNCIATIEQPLPVRTGTGGRRTLVQLEFY